MANVILKNRNGEPILHENRTSIKIPKQGGGEATFYESSGDSFWDQYLAQTLTEVTEDMLEGLTEIRRYLFDGQAALTRIELPNTITKIGENAFSSCYSLSEINIPSGVTSIGNRAFMLTDSFPHEFIHETPCQYGTTTDQASCFAYCPLRKVKIVLTNLYGLSGQMFMGDPLIEADITFPSTQSGSVIHKQAFYSCYQLSSLTLRSSYVVSLDYDHTNEYMHPFYGAPADFSIYVPSNLVNSYKSHADWSSRASYIFPIPT